MSATRARGPRVDGDGMKLTYFAKNNYDLFPDAVKAMYKMRDGVEDKAGYEAIAHRTCLNCPHDAFHMPHYEENCTLTHGAQEDSHERIGKVRAARARQRVLDNLERLKGGLPVSNYAALVAVARVMDEDAELDNGHELACEAMAALTSASEDMHADAFVASAEGAILALANCFACDDEADDRA